MRYVRLRIDTQFETSLYYVNEVCRRSLGFGLFSLHRFRQARARRTESRGKSDAPPGGIRQEFSVSKDEAFHYKPETKHKSARSTVNEHN